MVWYTCQNILLQSWHVILVHFLVKWEELINIVLSIQKVIRVLSNLLLLILQCCRPHCPIGTGGIGIPWEYGLLSNKNGCRQQREIFGQLKSFFLHCHTSVKHLKCLGMISLWLFREQGSRKVNFVHVCCVLAEKWTGRRCSCCQQASQLDWLGEKSCYLTGRYPKMSTF